MKKDRMIRNIYVMAVGLVAGACMTACSHEEDDIFDQSAAERLNAVGSVYSERLTQSPGGWVMEYYPYSDNEDLVTGTGYLIMNRFHDNGAVFTAMKNKASYNTFWTDSSSWQIVTYMGPVLTYNSYNRCFGRFSDPNDIDLTTARGEDESGKGFQGDYEFVMVDVPENAQHIMLKGVKRGVYQRLTRLPEGTDFEAYLDDISDFRKIHFVDNAQWELLLNDNGQTYKMNYADRGCATVYPADKDSTAYGWHMPFMVTHYDGQYHLRFKDTVMVGNVQMEQEYAFNEEEEVFHGVKNAENVITPYPAGKFFVEMLDLAHRWKMSVATEKSDDNKQVLANMISELAAGTTKYEINGSSDKDRLFYFRKVDDQLQLSFTVKFRRNNRYLTAELLFLYSMETDDNGLLTLNYAEPRGDGGKNIVESFPAVKTFLESFNGSYRVSGKETAFNLREVRLSSTTKENSWIILQYEN